LKEEIELMLKEIRSEYLGRPAEDRNYLFDYMTDELAKEMESVRLGKSGNFENILKTDRKRV
jgi:hypothetical protein